MAAIAEPYDTIIASASTTGKNVLPRVAALLDVAQVSDIIKVVAPDTFERPIYAGNAIQTVQTPPGKRVITVRTAAFKAAGEGGAAAPVEPVPGGGARGGRVALQGRGDRQVGPSGAGRGADHRVGGTLARLVGQVPRADRAAGRQPGGGGGRIAGGGGCGLRAERLAGRPDRQGGGAGPYVAVGISGAIQHLAGMKDSKVIVAINKDEDAPIFQVADYGLVGDLFQVVPDLQAEIGKAKGQ